MITFLLTYADGSSFTVTVSDASQLMDVAAFYGAIYAEIVAYQPQNK
jgi:hypothetical protein